MSNNFDRALSQAFKNEFSWLDDFENPYAGYKFSSQFEQNIKAIIPKAEFTYVSVGNRRVRKTLLAALVALLAVAITGCAVAAYYIVEWHEEQNDKQGTLDVVFKLKGEVSSTPKDINFPTAPEGYTISEQYNDDFSCIIIYSDSNNNQIIYSHCNDIENMSTSIDNEDANFEEITINECKGYKSSKDGINALYWADSAYLYELQGTCDIDTLLTMTESMIE